MQGLRWLRSTYEAAVPSGSVAQKVVETYSFAVWTQDTILAWYVCASFVRCKGCGGWRTGAVVRQQCRAAPLRIANSGRAPKRCNEAYSCAGCTHNDILAWCVRANFVRCKGCAVCGAVARQQGRAHQLRMANSGRAQKVVEAYARRMTS